MNILFHKKYYKNSEVFNYINNNLDINGIIKNSKIIKIIKDNERSVVKIVNYNGHKIILKQYKGIKNKYYTTKEFINISYVYYNNIINVPEPIGCLINYKYNIIKEAFLLYYYIEEQPCENIYKEISKFYNYMFAIDYLYTDIKKEHFIYNNNKLYIIDLDHHFKKNNYGIIKQNILFKKQI